MPKYKVVIASEVYSENLGDGLIYESFARLLRSRGLEVVPIDLSSRKGWARRSGTVSDSRSSKARSFVKKILRRSSFFRRAVTRVRWLSGGRKDFVQLAAVEIERSDAVFVGGGQLLNDTNLEFPVRIQEVVKMARVAGKPVVLFGVGVSRVWSNEAHHIYKKIFRSVDFVAVRDQVSRQRLVDRTNYAAPVHVHPDLAFSICSGQDGTKEKACDQELVVGLNIMAFSVFRRYVPALRDVDFEIYLCFWLRLTRAVLKDGYVPRLFVNGGNADWEDAKTVHEYLIGHGVDVSLLDNPETPSDLLELLRSLDIVVATRMHAGITGFSLGKSVASISWDDKVDSVWKEVGSDPVVSPDVIFSDDPWFVLRKALVRLDSEGEVEGSLAGRIEASLDRCLEDVFNTGARQ